MKKTFIVATDKIDSQCDKIILSGIKIPDKVLLIKDFNPHKILGYATVENTGTKLIANADIPDELINTYPAIGFQVMKTHREENIRFLDEIILHSISLSRNANVDESIKPINEQKNPGN